MHYLFATDHIEIASPTLIQEGIFSTSVEGNVGMGRLQGI